MSRSPVTSSFARSLLAGTRRRGGHSSSAALGERHERSLRSSHAPIAAAVIAMGVAACSSDADDSPAEDGPAPVIVWDQCPPLAQGAPSRDPGQTCGTLKVPLDYTDPGGATIELAVSRIASARPGQRRGVLLLNPGGPALPGLDTPSAMAPTLPQSVLDRYDLIGFDPRGVEHSTAQSCGLGDGSLSGFFPYPAADGSITRNVDLATTTAAQCASVAGSTLQYFTTANTARDLDRIRRALGEDKVSYWGQSYGTYLGAVYSALFQDRTDRVILEGNVDPTKVWSGHLATQGKGMAERFPDAAAVAAAQSDALGLGATVAEVTSTYLALADRLDRQPAPLPGTALSLTGPLLRNVTYALLLHNETLPVLVQFWKAAADLADEQLDEADAAVLQQVLADSPSSPGIPADNQLTVALALLCGDVSWSRDVDEYAARTAEDRATWPLTAGMPANILPCAFWQYPPIEAPVSVGDTGTRNILILQNRRDHATPWESAVGLRHSLGSRAAFVGVDNGGHYVYDAGSRCADQATINLLADGVLPEADLDCSDVSQRDAGAR